MNRSGSRRRADEALVPPDFEIGAFGRRPISTGHFATVARCGSGDRRGGTSGSARPGRRSIIGLAGNRAAGHHETARPSRSCTEQAGRRVEPLANPSSAAGAESAGRIDARSGRRMFTFRDSHCLPWALSPASPERRR